MTPELPTRRQLINRFSVQWEPIAAYLTWQRNRIVTLMDHLIRGSLPFVKWSIAKLFFRQQASLPHAFDRNYPLLWLSGQDAWTLGDLIEGGLSVFGTTGSGKSTCIANLAASMLDAGYGGIVLTVTREDKAHWQWLARKTGRESSLILLSPGGPWRFNFLDHFHKQERFVENVVDLFLTVLEVGEREQRQGLDQPFWRDQQRTLLRNLVSLCSLALGRVSLPEMHGILKTAPQRPSDPEDVIWQSESYCYQLVNKLEYLPLSAAQKREAAMNRDYWFKEFAGLAERTRSVVVASVAALFDLFLRDPLYTLFCTETTITPEATHEGAVIVVDMPTLVDGVMARYCNVLMKYLWQRATQKREVGPHTRPVFCYSDENARHAVAADGHFSAISRRSRAINVILSQNYSGYIETMGKEAADTLLANYQCACYFCLDHITANYAANMIGKDWQERGYSGLSASGLGLPSLSQGESDRFEWTVPPIQFQLKKAVHPILQRRPSFFKMGAFSLIQAKTIYIHAYRSCFSLANRRQTSLTNH